MNRQTATAEATSFIVVNIRTGRKVAGPFTEIKRARRAVDRHDDVYGGYAHKIVDSDGRGGI